MSEEKRPQAVCMTVSIVGAVREIDGEVGAQLQAFRAAVEALLWEHFPDFLPAYPAVVVNTYDVRDDWIKRGPKDGTTDSVA